MFDLEQVEVLRGPQGTLFGRNTVGGAITVRRTRPTEEVGLRFKTRIGRHRQREFLVVGNTGQLADVVSSKFYFFRNSDETFATNTISGQAEPAADSISYGGAFLFEPTSNFEALISVDAFNDDSFGQPVFNLTEPTGAIPPLGNFCDLTLVAFSSDAGCSSASLAPAEASGFSTFVRAFPFQNFIDGWSITSEIKYELSNNLTLTSITGYRETDEELFEENTGSAPVTVAPGVTAPLFVARRLQDFEQFSQELRVDGSVWEDRVDFVAGLYYLNTDFSINGGAGPFGPAAGFGTAFVLGAPVADFVAGQQLQAVAGFFDATLQVTDRFSFSGGFRYTYERKDFNTNFIVSATNPGILVATDEEFTSPTGRGIFQYQFTDTISGYAG